MTKRNAADWSLYLVTDPDLIGGRDLVEIVCAAVRGGVTAVQFRDKQAEDQDFVETGRRLREALGDTGVPLIVNDRVELTAAIGAEGVHLGQSDLSVERAREALGPEALIGLSVETEAQAVEAEDLDVDYLGVSPVFATPTKTDTATPWGLSGLSRLKELSSHPLVAIGGIHPHNAASVIQAGAVGIAVVSAICAADDPEKAADTLAKLVAEAGRY